MEALSDLDTFTKILTEKGYDGYFHTQGAYVAKLKESISAYLENAPKGMENMPKPELLLRCYLKWEGEDKPSVECLMWVKYHDEKFNLKKMEVMKKDRFGQLLKQSKLTNLSTITAPSAKEAIATVSDSPLQKMAPRNKRFRL